MMRWLTALFLLAGCSLHAQVPGRNVNMVSGTSFPDGDPYLQRQNEPSIAVSTRNPLHILGGANDYRAVDLPGLVTNNTGDAWLGVFKSFDGGNTWRSSLLPGCPQNIPACNGSPLKGYEAASDPVVRAGTNGLFFYAGVAFNRGAGGNSAIFAARFIDDNNKENGDTIGYQGASIVDTGNATRFVDKPWLATDIPRVGALACTVNGQLFAGGNAYIVYSAFLGLNNEPAEQRSIIYFSRTRDCGVTWSAPKALTSGTSLAQGASIAIEPLTGTIWVVWRQFQTAGFPDAVIGTRSVDSGATFSAPVTVAGITPFDQPATAYGFRTNSYPTIAVDSSSPARAYVAWSQRGMVPTAVTDARVVLSNSTDGTAWSAPRLMESFNGRGHQVMPALTFAAGKLMLLYYDQRDSSTAGELRCPTATCATPAEYTEVRPLAGDLISGSIDKVFNNQLMDAGPPTYNPGINPVGRRQSIDVRVAQADPGALPVFTSVRVSEYMFGNASGQPQQTRPVAQLRYNAPNVPLFAGGTRAFIGDYIDLAASPAFLATQSGTRTVWRFNTAPSAGATFYAAWTDNRDVIPPRDGNWQNYTPPKTVSASTFNPAQSTPTCVPENTGMRNQNIYLSRITQGILLGSPTNTKTLSTTIQRSFIVFLQNSTNLTRIFRLFLPQGTALAGGRASFLPSSALAQLEVKVGPRSSITRPVFATSSDPRARIAVNAAEIATLGGAVIIGGLNSSIALNSDGSNPDLVSPDPGNASSTPIQTAEIFNPDLTNPDLTNPDLTNPDLTNPDLTNPDLTNPDLTNPDLTNPDLTNPDLTNPVVANPDLTNPDLTNPDLTNGALTDATYRITNRGNTTAPYSIKLIKKTDLPAGYKLQLVVYKTYTTPAARGCTLLESTHNVLVANVPNPVFSAVGDLTNPDLTNPDLTNVTLFLEPGQQARATLRVLAPTRQAGQDVIQTVVKPSVVAQASNVQVQAPGTPPPPPAPPALALIVTTQSMPSTVRTRAYNAPLAAIGGNGALTWSLAGGTPPPGLTVNANGSITGTATAAGSYLFTVRVVDSSTPQPQNDTQLLSITVAELIAIASTSPLRYTRIGIQAPASLQATGGFPSYTWLLVTGTLPTGLTLNANGTFGGLATTLGTYTFSVSVADAGGPLQQTASRTFQMSVLPRPQLLGISPASAAQGKVYTVAVSGQDVDYTPGATVLSLGSDIAVSNLVVTSPTTFTATLTVSPSAFLGLRGVTVNTGTETASIPNAFNVLARPIIGNVTPNNGARTQTLAVVVAGLGTHFAPGATAVTFSGNGITVNSTTVTDPNHVTVNLSISAVATMDARNVTVTTGTETDTANGSFTVTQGYADITGVVYQSNGVTPAGSATVRLYSAGNPIAIQVSNVLGSYTFAGQALGSYTTWAADTGDTQLATAAPVVALHGVTVTSHLTLSGTGTVTVNVRDVRDNAVPNAGVTLTNTTYAPPAQFTSPNRAGTTNAAGQVAFSGVTAGNLQAAASAAGFANGAAALTLAPGDSPAITVVLPDVLTIASTSPLPYTRVTNHPAALRATGGAAPRVWSLVSGTLPPGLSVNSDGSFGGNATTTGTYTFTVRVTDAAGLSQQTTTVTLQLEVRPRPQLLSLTPSTGAIGLVYNVAGAAQDVAFLQGSTQLNFGSDITVSNFIVITPTTFTATLTVSPTVFIGTPPANHYTATVSTVTSVFGDTETATLANAFHVIAQPKLYDIPISPTAIVRTQTLDVTISGSATHFTPGSTVAAFTGNGLTINSATVLSTEAVRVNLTASTGADLTQRSVTVTTGSEVVSGANIFTVTQGYGSIGVNLSQAGGLAPAPNATVRLYSSGGSLVATQVTDASGWTLFTNQPLGSYTLWAADSGATQLAKASASVVLHGGSGIVPMNLSGTGTVTINVVNRSAVPIANANVTLTNGTYIPPPDFTSPTRSGTTNAGGQLVLNNVVAGSLTASASATGYLAGSASGALTAGGSTTITVTENSTIACVVGGGANFTSFKANLIAASLGAANTVSLPTPAALVAGHPTKPVAYAATTDGTLFSYPLDNNCVPGAPAVTPPLLGPALSMAIHPSGTLLYTARPGGVVSFRLDESGYPIFVSATNHLYLEPGITHIAISASGILFASRASSIATYSINIATSALTPSGPGSPVAGISFLTAGGPFVQALTATEFLFFDGISPIGPVVLRQSLPLYPGSLTSLAVHPDGPVGFAASSGGMILPLPSLAPVVLSGASFTGATVDPTGTFLFAANSATSGVAWYQIQVPTGALTYLNAVAGVGVFNSLASVMAPLLPPPDLTIDKSHAGNFLQGQAGATYVVTVGNSAGASASVGTVTVTDTLPAGLTATAIGGADWTCVLGTLTCTRSDALAGGGTYSPITVTVNVAGTAPASVTNTASVSGGGEWNTANNTFNDVTLINANPPSITGLTPGSAKKNTTAGITVTGQNMLGATFQFQSPVPGVTAVPGPIGVISNDGVTAVLSFPTGSAESQYTLVASHSGGSSAVTAATQFVVLPAGTFNMQSAALGVLNVATTQALSDGHGTAVSGAVGVLNIAAPQALSDGHGTAVSGAVGVLNVAAPPVIFPAGQNSIGSLTVAVCNVASGCTTPVSGSVSPPVAVESRTPIGEGRGILLTAEWVKPGDGATVDFEVNGAVIGSVSEAPYAMRYTVPAGVKELVFRAIVRLPSGAVASSGGVRMPVELPQLERGDAAAPALLDSVRVGLPQGSGRLMFQ